jgi:phosphoglycolate phosphatase
MLPAFKAVIFDLDGTLIDTIHDLANAVNEVLASRNLHQHSIESYKHRVGDGIKLLLQRSVPENLSLDKDLIEQIMLEFNHSYEQHWNKNTLPYPGIVSMFQELQHINIKKAILSNKPQYFTDLCAKHFFPEIAFDLVLGASSDVPKKPNPTSALFIAHHMNVSPEEVIYVGDTSIDMSTAKNAGMYPVGVSWGFRSQEELIEAGAKILLNYPEELMLIVSKQA